jgi:hypothetical protein
VEAWASGLRALRRLEGVLHLHVGSVRSWSYGGGDGGGAWTHALYGRYKDKESLAAYAAHPEHVRAVARGAPLFSAVMALDWLAAAAAGRGVKPAPIPPPRWIAFFKWAPGTAPDAAVPRLVASALHQQQPHHHHQQQQQQQPHQHHQQQQPQQPQQQECEPGRGRRFTLGPNFSPARARGFQWGLATFHLPDGLPDDGSPPPPALAGLAPREPVNYEILLLRFSPMPGPAASM